MEAKDAEKDQHCVLIIKNQKVMNLLSPDYQFSCKGTIFWAKFQVPPFSKNHNDNLIHEIPNHSWSWKSQGLQPEKKHLT
jgi:hypothetical protein